MSWIDVETFCCLWYYLFDAGSMLSIRKKQLDRLEVLPGGGVVAGCGRHFVRRFSVSKRKYANAWRTWGLGSHKRVPVWGLV